MTASGDRELSGWIGKARKLVMGRDRSRNRKGTREAWRLRGGELSQEKGPS
jgi:hypothetical protein